MPSQTPRSEATTFESLTTAAWAQIVAAELFLELLALDDSDSAFDFRF